MKINRLGVVSGAWIALVLAAGCAPPKEVTEHDRKQAAFLATEAQFAVSIREWSRAEELLAQAVRIAPSADYWFSLGATRVRLDNRSGAKDAYESALALYGEDTKRFSGSSEPWLRQAYVLALLGRKDASRTMLAKAARQFPDDGRVQALNDPKEFEAMITSQKFKDMAL